MKEGQEHIYYVTAENYQAAKNNPQLEVFAKKGIEVILLSDRVDEWLVAHVTEFDGKKLQSVAMGDLSDIKATEEEKAEQEKTAKDFEAILKQMKETLGEKVQEVRLSQRLTDSPSCVVAPEGMSMHLQRLMASSGQQMPAQAPVLEINADHPLVKQLKNQQDDALFNQWSEVLLNKRCF